jgi:flavin-dependent dehydrogenase
MGGGYDAIVVGARCAGAVLAARLAGAGWRVLLVDRAGFPSDTVSTHFLFPNTLDRLARLGVMDRLCAGHDIPPLLFSWRVLGHQVAGGFTPTGGYDRLACVRRITLDAALVDAALAAGAVGRFGTRVTGLVGGGRAGDPVGGVVLAGGEVVRARWGRRGGRARLDGGAGARPAARTGAGRGVRAAVRLLDRPAAERVVPDRRPAGQQPDMLPL